MTLDDLQRITNRSLALTWDYKKLFVTFCTLALSGLAFVACHSIALHSGSWVAISLMFLPMFFTGAALMAVGVVLVRVYHDQVKERATNFKQVFFSSWQLMAAASYLTVPIVLAFLLLWMAQAIFYLFKEIPLLGDLLGVVLAFWPFLLNVAVLLLVVGLVGMLFFVTPIVALRGITRVKVSHIVLERWKQDIFSNFFQFTLGLIPFILSAGMLVVAACLTKAMGFSSTVPLQVALQSLFIMIPAAALLAPSVVFFFNFAAESHVISQDYLREMH